MNPLQVTEVKIFGERNTSTNAIKRLIEMNSQARVLPSMDKELRPGFHTSIPRKIATRILGKAWRERGVDRIFASVSPRLAWKHCAPDFEDLSDFREALVIFTTRDPFSWLLALHRRPYHVVGRVPESFAEFIVMPWQPYERDRIDTKPVTPIQLYNLKLGAQLRFRDRLVAAGMLAKTVKFEDFAIDQLAVLDELGPHLAGMVAHPSALVSAAKAKDQGLGRDVNYYRDYYGNARWRDEVDPAARATIDAGIDWTLAGQVGYERW